MTPSSPKTHIILVFVVVTGIGDISRGRGCMSCGVFVAKQHGCKGVSVLEGELGGSGG